MVIPTLITEALCKTKKAAKHLSYNQLKKSPKSIVPKSLQDTGQNPLRNHSESHNLDHSLTF